MYIVYYICTHVWKRTRLRPYIILYIIIDERNVSVPSKTVLHVFDARMIDSRGTHVVVGGWGKREKSSKKPTEKTALRDDGVSFFFPPPRPEIVLCVCHVCVAIPPTAHCHYRIALFPGN